MSASNSTINPSQFELSPCRVTYKGVDVGATLGNVVVKNETGLAELKSDQLGTTPIDHRVSGHKFTIVTSFAEVKFKENWKIIFPMHKLVTQGPNTLFYFDSQVGYSQVSQAGLLQLHPLSLPDSDLSEDFNVYLAAADGKAEYTFSPTEQVKLTCNWNVYPDFTTIPPRFYSFGDPSIGLVNASAGAATAGTGNVGDGTVTSIAVFNGYTVTEVVSLNCVTPGTAGAFFVSGTLSGALGLALNGVTFNSSQISFIVNNGSTPFALNDSFTIATTASNYN
jgi:hypothetical protein